MIGFQTVAGDYGALLFFFPSPAYGDMTGHSAFFDMVNRQTGAVVCDDQAAGICNGTYLIDGVSRALTPADGVLFYEFKGGELSVPGFYEGRFRVVPAGGQPTSLPSDGVIDIQIGKDLA